VQEIYLRAYAAFGSYRGENTRAWLAAICLNAARSQERRRRPWEVPEPLRYGQRDACPFGDGHARRHGQPRHGRRRDDEPADPGQPRHRRRAEADRGHAASYNYSRFDDYVAAGGDLADEAAFRASPRAGQRAEDFTLPLLGDGAQVRLSELWRSTPLVMEFGSFT